MRAVFIFAILLSLNAGCLRAPHAQAGPEAGFCTASGAWEDPGLYDLLATLATDPRAVSYRDADRGLRFDPDDGQNWSAHLLRHVYLREEDGRHGRVSADTAPGGLSLSIPIGTSEADARRFGAYFLRMTVGDADQLDDLFANASEVRATDGEGGVYRGAPVVGTSYFLRTDAPLRLNEIAQEFGMKAPDPRRDLAEVKGGNWTYWMPEKVRTATFQTEGRSLFLAARPGGRVVARLDPADPESSAAEEFGEAMDSMGLRAPPGSANYTWSPRCRY